MAYVNMDKAPVDIGENTKFAFEKTITLSSAGNSSWVMIPKGVQRIVVTIIPTTATGRVEASSDTVNEVKTGTPTAVSWDLGDVSVTTQDWCYPPTALRCVQTGAGSVVMKIRAQ